MPNHSNRVLWGLTEATWNGTDNGYGLVIPAHIDHWPEHWLAQNLGHNLREDLGAPDLTVEVRFAERSGETFVKPTEIVIEGFGREWTSASTLKQTVSEALDDAYQVAQDASIETNKMLDALEPNRITQR